MSLSNWISTKDSLPAVGKEVLACYKEPGRKPRVTVARWQPAKTLDCSDWEDPPEHWWDEDGDLCLNPADCWVTDCIELLAALGGEQAGESVDLATEMGQIVTHWMPLPELP